jgi:hypothetical protein
MWFGGWQLKGSEGGLFIPKRQIFRNEESVRGSSRLSPLPPHLFNYFCSDFPCEAKVNKLYADDFNLSESSPSVEVLSEKLTECPVGVSEWSSKNKLAIAPAKSSVTLFTPDIH